jgi:hypothetical protein
METRKRFTFFFSCRRNFASYEYLYKTGPQIKEHNWYPLGSEQTVEGLVTNNYKDVNYKL